MVTGTSVLGVKFKGGVIIAADMLGSYGSLARFRNISRLMKVRTTVHKLQACTKYKTMKICLICLCAAGE